MLSRSFHTSRLLKNGKVWSNFAFRSKSLGINSDVVKKAVLDGMLASGPPSIKRKFNRTKYNSPENIDSMFKLSYDFLQNKAAALYEELEKIKDPTLKDDLLVKAEINNPEVQYNFEFHDKIDNDPAIIDYEQPVYRYLGRENWKSYRQMLLMQRLETLKAIPDTLPTLEPKADVHVKFPYSTGINKWINSGETLSTLATSLPPVFKVQEYDSINVDKQLYTILVVNPDVPDLINDTYCTCLNYGLTNLKLKYNDNIIDLRNIEKEHSIIADYLPPVPEENIGLQRFIVWVFRNKESININNLDIDRNNFNIRKFAKDNELEAIGSEIWRSEFDSNVSKVREMYGLPKGRLFTKTRN
ncbi:hypothetical protein TPHA_0D02110 [Tetrapisispora phaffii CBS 4417]|uniref:Large ribosomal subunit protein mL38 n=1 Tax=Tetrapisispora phaffii (strain ATCC 24235 / CBS 4417 / NBRC 1672 / NRRL Y-8282 / UCD 70-5) TaxID=1071381 RepID=G8BSM8_TETPH|nr:mitochondrial 54S ribosomal protein YmL35 TPHA_0D02110 [Tetrapisispora phaffii CBS 4417]CCE62849.1 hypothetical protein TPHA_0D02110 [Tetrapisispora phaffii CBS 4417]